MKNLLIPLLVLLSLTAVLINTGSNKTRKLNKSFITNDISQLTANNPNQESKPEILLNNNYIEKLYLAKDNGIHIIGTEENSWDNTSDNTIIINIEDDIETIDEIYLEYELFGLNDNISVCKSFNESLAYGGMIIKTNDKWSYQSERISPEVLNKGLNYIRFSTYNEEHSEYRVKNVRLRCLRNQNEYIEIKPKIIITKIGEVSTGNEFIYISGFINGLNDRNLEVSISGKAISSYNGVFEALIPIEEVGVKENIITVLAKIEGKTELVKELNISTLINADYVNKESRELSFIEKDVNSDDSFKLTLGAISLFSEPGFVGNQTKISLTGLRRIDMPALGEDMVNVTATHYGYRCLPHGANFKNNITIKLKYDPLKIPAGYGPQDIGTFYFNDTLNQWVRLTIDSINIENNEVVSVSNHFTDFINAIIKEPELPQNQAFTPTSVKDLEYANPLSGINIISPPVANNQGSLNYSFPFQIPQGRQGMQPQLSINYSSDAGNGNCGVGWNINIPAIEVETKWGTPRFIDTLETESYIVSGEQIVELEITQNDTTRLPLVHMAEYRERSVASQTFYSYRIEGAFNRIIRHGNSTDTYWWEVIDKNGVRYFYGKYSQNTGVNDSLVLRQPDSDNIAYWALAEVCDLYGNFVRYEYNKVIAQEPVLGQQLYIENIIYTGFDNTQGKYNVEFDKINRDDIIMSGNFGFVQLTDKLYRSVSIYYDNLCIRKYLLNYKEGSYQKTVLASIADITDLSKEQYVTDIDDCSSLVQYQGATVHCMDYYEEDGLEFSETASVITDVEENESEFLGGLVTDTAKFSIGKSWGASMGVGGSANINFGPTPLKLLAAGVNYQFSMGLNNETSQLIDLNGDGLTDRILKNGSDYEFCKGVLNENNELMFETPAVDIFIEGEPFLGYSTNTSHSIGGEVSASAAAASYTYTTTKQVNSRYFADINGDGFPDFVSGEKVYFNKPDNDGIPEFSLCGSNPEQPLDESGCYNIIYDGVAEGGFSEDVAEDINRRDPVRMWIAPFYGKTEITGSIQRINASENYSDTIFYSIMAFPSNESPIVYNGSIAPDNIIPITIQREVWLHRGDAVYFRIHSDNTIGFDDVNWDINIMSPTCVMANNNETLQFGDADEKKLYLYNYEDDIVIHDQQYFVAPFTGSIIIDASLESPAQSDVLSYNILLNQNALYSNTFTDATSFSNTYHLDLNVDQGDTIRFLLKSQSNVNWSDVDFNGKIEYDTIVYNNELIEKSIKFYPSLQMSIFNNIMCLSRHNTLSAGSYTVQPSLAFGGLGDGEITFTAKSKRNLLDKKTLTILNGALQGGSTNYLQFTLASTDTVFFDYYTDDTAIINNLAVTPGVWNAHALIQGNPNIEVRSGFFGVLPDTLQKFGNLYRGWGQFSYLDDSHGACDLIDEDLLFSELELIESDDAEDFPYDDIDEDTEYDDVVSMFDDIGISNETPPAFSIMMADRENNRWVDFCKGASIDEESMICGLSSSIIIDSIDNPEIFGTDAEFDVSLFNQSTSLGNSKAPKKQSRQQTNSFSVKFGVPAASLSFTKTTTNSRGLVDFMDMNGDGFPDIVGTKKIQYTDAQGGLSRDVFEFDEKFTSEGKSVSTGDAYGIKGTVFANSKTSDANKSKLKNIIGSFGIGVNDGVSIVSALYFDVNADGLPDRVSADYDSVQYNVGYSFLDAIPYDIQANLSDTRIQSESMTLGLNLDFLNLVEYSFAFGLGGNFNNSLDFSTIVDVNNDGLTDVCYLEHNGTNISLKALINTGNGFYNIVLDPSFNKPIASSRCDNYATNSALSFTITIVGYLNLLISGYNDISFSFSKDSARLSDINGDGFVDFVFVDGNNTKAFFGIPKKNNIIKSITTPGLAVYSTDYKCTYPDINNPRSKWVMSELKVNDGFAGDGKDTLFYKYEYKSGKYHRYERESLGFDTVVSTQYDNFADNNLYRSTTDVYRTDDFLFKGLKSKEIFIGASGEKLVKSFIWNKKDISTGEVMEEPVECFGPYYPAISYEIAEYYEGYQTPGITTTKEYQHGAYGNVKKYINYNNDAYATDDVAAEITYNYDLSSHLLNLPISVFVKDHDNNLLRQTDASYNQQGSIINISKYLDGSNLAEIDFTYDQYGNIYYVEYPENNVSERFTLQYDYDNETNTYPVRITDYWGNASFLDYDLRFGLPDTITDICGNQMFYSFYNDGRINTITSPKEIESSIPYTIKYEYWDEISTSVPHRWALTRHYDPTLTSNEFLTTNICDGNGKIVQSKKRAIIDAQDMVVISGKSYYDFYGRLDSVSQPGVEAYNANTFTSYSIFTPENFTRYGYDVFDRNTVIHFPDLTSVSFAYDFVTDPFGQNCFRKITTDQNNNSTAVCTEARGLQTYIKDALGQETKFMYSPMSELTRSIDPEDNRTDYNYDHLGRVISRDHPDAGITSYKYDLAGNLIGVQTANLEALALDIEYIYHHCRLTEIHYPQNPEMDVYYEYGDPSTGNQTGKLIRQQDASGVQEYYYGNMGELVKNIHTFVVPGGEPYTFQTEWKYDSWNRIVSMTYPDGEMLYYKYNDEGNLVFLAGEKGNFSYEYIESIKYDKYGRRTQIQYGNGTSAEYSYDDKNLRLKTLVSYENGGHEMQHLDYTYDLAGNITAVENSGDFLYGNVGGEYDYNYEYDEIYRLTHAEGSFDPYNQQTIGFKLDLSYSSSGNILEKDMNGTTLINGGTTTFGYQNTYDYTGRPHTVTEAGDYTYDWDLNGNMIRRINHNSHNHDDRYFCWDEENRLSAVRDVSDLSQSSIYIYDAGGERAWKLNGEEMLTQVNGQTVSSNIYFEKTLYTSPYLVMTERDYTKHYYIEGERVCSKIGGGFGPASVQPADSVLDFIHGDYELFGEALLTMCQRHLECVDYEGEWELYKKLDPAGNVEDSLENLQYFYHSDHLGSAAVISFTSGRAYQHLQYFPYGELFVSQRNSSFDSRYKFSAKELDNETGYSYFGARYYDSDLSVWLSVDPMAGKYPSISPYAYCANNPLTYIDPDGREIRIYYKEKRGIGRLFERAKYITYTPGMSYSGDNKFVRNSVNSLNYINDNNADIESIISQSVATSEIVKVKKSSSDYYDDSNNTIHWSTKGMKVRDNSSGNETKGRQTGALGLFHELGHFYREVFKPSEFDKDFKTEDPSYDNLEERRVIEDYETPAAKILNEGTRNNHGGLPLNTVDPTSIQTRREIHRTNKIND